MWVAPTTADFKAFFMRDFPYAPTDDDGNIDLIGGADITRAINEGLLTFSEGLYGTEAQSTNAFMYLAAFHLVENLKMSAKGLAALAQFPIESSSVGGVSNSFAIPEKYKNHPVLSQYLSNAYGKKFIELTLPYLVGNIAVMGGTTTY